MSINLAKLRKDVGNTKRINTDLKSEDGNSLKIKSASLDKHRFAELKDKSKFNPAFISESFSMEEEEEESEASFEQDQDANYSDTSFHNVEMKSLKKKEQRERRKRLRERTEKKKMVDKMVGLLEVDEEEDDMVVKDPMSKCEVLFTLIISFVFFFNFLSTIDIYGAYEMKESVSSIIENKPFDNEGNTFRNVKKIKDLNMFLSNVIIDQFYNESLKYYGNNETSYHYINKFNYLVGMRLTHQKVELKDSKQYDSFVSEDLLRMRNYKGSTNKHFKDIDKTPFGRYKVEYQDSEGYYNKGGFIHYFSSNLTTDEAHTYFNELVEDGLFDRNLMALTLEAIFYNENRQTGVQLIYQFMINNAGHVETENIDATMYNKSLYRGSYRQYSSSMKTFLQLIDLIYVIGIIWIITVFIRTIYRRIADM